MSRKSHEPKAKAIFVGDLVERISGVYVGLTGRVIACKPKSGPWTSQIKVKVDLDQFTGRQREKIGVLVSKWNSVASWQVINNPLL